MSFDYSPIMFKIPGTEIELPIIKIPKKEKQPNGTWVEKEPTPYMQVPQRLVWFNHEKPDWIIETEIEREWEIPDKEGPIQLIRIKAVIKDPSGKVMRMARKTKEVYSSKDYDSCETGAVGRCLALIGYGTGYATQDIEEEEVIDSPTGLKKEIKSDTRSKVVSQSSGGATTSPSIDLSNITAGVQNNEPRRSPSPKQDGPPGNGGPRLVKQLSDISRALEQEKATTGIWTGLSFKEIFEKDQNAKPEFKWTKARYAELKMGNPLPEWSKKYLTYADMAGLNLE